VVETGDCPRFIAADQFEGARPGYYFGLSEEGLGYYYDSRQPRLGTSSKKASHELKMPFASSAGANESRSASAPSNSVALVTEVSTTELETRTLPPRAKQYVDSSSAIMRPILASSVSNPNSLPEFVSNWRQNNQNLILFMDITAEHEIGDVQVRIVGQRLTLCFCVRRTAGPSSDSLWQRMQIKWSLCGAVDPRQWHADVSERHGCQRLAIVIRKAERLAMWEHIVDTSSAPKPEHIDEASAASNCGNEQLVTTANAGTLDALDDDVASPSLGSGAASVTVPQLKADDVPSQMEDSSELDAAAPQDGGGKAVVQPSLAKGQATDAMIQSATVMGQSVLLRNRLMYQLL